jgi:DNA primase
MDYENIDFPQAVENLASSVGLEVPREQAGGAHAPAGEAPNRPLYAFLERCDAFYREALRQHPQAARAVDYLKSRGLSGLIARDFGLGYAPPGWDNLHKVLARDETLRRVPGPENRDAGQRTMRAVSTTASAIASCSRSATVAGG